MVRLVFRPYTQIWRSIWTSESLRASIRVSPDFALLRHSSPSFGSQQICSSSNLSSKNHDWPMVRVFEALPPRAARSVPFTFITHPGFSTLILAYMLDSLVRVTRRVDWRHFVSISIAHSTAWSSGATGWDVLTSTPPSAHSLDQYDSFLGHAQDAHGEL